MPALRSRGALALPRIRDEEAAAAAWEACARARILSSALGGFGRLVGVRA